jgi:hypothetical protein
MAIENINHRCDKMPPQTTLEDRYIVFHGCDGSTERSESKCNFCPFCGVKLKKE